MLSSSIWNFIDAKIMAIGVLALSCAYFYYENKSLNDEIQILNLKNLHLDNEAQSAKIQILKQNEAFKVLELQTQNINLKDEQAFKNLDSLQNEFENCESELKNYKELFNIFSKANK